MAGAYAGSWAGFIPFHPEAWHWLAPPSGMQNNAFFSFIPHFNENFPCRAGVAGFFLKTVLEIEKKDLNLHSFLREKPARSSRG